MYIETWSIKFHIIIIMMSEGACIICYLQLSVQLKPTVTACIYGIYNFKLEGESILAGSWMFIFPRRYQVSKSNLTIRQM